MQPDSVRHGATEMMAGGITLPVQIKLVTFGR